MFALTAHSLAALQRGFDEAPAFTKQELLAVATEATQLIESEVKEIYPRGINESYTQISSEAFTTPAGVLGVVGMPSPHAYIVEFGRKPGTGVSKKGQVPLTAWAKSKRPELGEKELKSFVFLITRKIKAEGLPARRPFGNTFDRHKGYITGLIEAAAGRITDHLAKRGAST